ncbi:hypothetical protein MIM_c31910 [Advenella mimigardefordensis DPN7]|uniref:Uncharacterized protein n=1 Tax=Advenella mimigardefordensis (strain DSM 17166 / LMG 22922 / DPN7) TaxID=1247726 RepID=W0PIJ6_ADVMD|nr:hypothetical protein MIM_c31910 [Advenella mimigardefordensis DPN7]
MLSKCWDCPVRNSGGRMAKKPKNKSKKRGRNVTRKSNVIEREPNNMINSVFRRLEVFIALMRVLNISKSLWDGLKDQFFP